MSTIFTVQALICLSIYFCLILSFFIGWLRTKQYHPDSRSPSIQISILIPCRNEAENIPGLAASLMNQDYPADQFEIIWIDDHSSDGTAQLLDDLIRNQNHQHLVRLPESVSGKKAALKAGMEIATGELILLTDADSRPGISWLKTMAGFFEDTGNDLILGPVVLDPVLTGFDRIQKLEYMSLVASSIGAAGIGNPIMAQGPNIGVRAADYRTIVNDLDNRFASGDDVFLLQEMKKIPGKRIGYVLNPDAIVRSKPAKSVTGFLHQRSRWASKATGYQHPFMIFTTLLVFMANLEILAALVFDILGIVPFSFVLILLGIKTIADSPLLYTATRFFRCPRLLVWLVPVQVLYPLYITVAGVFSQIAPIRWKNRSES